MPIEPMRIKPGEETPATVPDETGATQEPEKFQIPGLDGEHTAEEIVRWHGKDKNETKWRRDMSEKGEKFNEEKRQWAARRDEQEDRMNKRIDDLTTRLNQPQTPAQPQVDWQQEEDPDKRQEKFFQSVDNRVTRIEADNRDFREDSSAQSKVRQEKTAMEGWQMVADGCLDKHGAPENPKFREVVEATMGKFIAEVPKERWTSALFNEAAKRAVGTYKEIGENANAEYLKGKKKDAGLETGSPGKGTAPKTVRFSAGMSKKERQEIIAKDPNA